MKIEVEESALESLKAMAQRLQEERDELLAIVQKFDRAARQSSDAVDFSVRCDSFVFEAREVIAKCTAEVQP